MSDKSYQALMDAHQKLLGQLKHFRELLQEKDAEIKQLHQEKQNEDTIIREFCASYLSDSNEEMKDENSKQWGNLSIPELLNRTKTALEEKETDWVRRFQNFLQELEKRRAQVRTLQEENEKLRKIVAGQEDLAPEEQHQSGAKIEYIQKEDEDILGQAEDEMLQEASKLNMVTCLRDGALQVLENEKVLNRKKQLKKKQKDPETGKTKEAVSLEQYEDILKDIDWCVLQCIGEKGLSSISDISEAAAMINPSFKERKIRPSAALVNSLGLTESAMITTFKGKTALYNLTEKGKTVYRLKYLQDPVMSEWENLIDQHTSLEHGYGIKSIADTLRKTPYYKQVNEFMRSNPVILSGGKKYIPDILCVGDKNQTLYIEYELNTCSQSDFNNKCERMKEATKYMNFVVKNQPDTTEILSRLDRWMKTKKNGVLNQHTIRVTTAFHVQDIDLWQNASWKYLIQPANSLEPKVMF